VMLFIEAMADAAVSLGIKRDDALKIAAGTIMGSGKLCLELLGFGIPMGFQLALTGIGGIFNQSAINRFGTDYIAAVGSTVKIQNLVMQPMESLGVAMITYTSQNLGAGKIDRIRDGIKRAAWLMAALVVLAFLVVWFGSPLLLLLFVKPEETVVVSVAVAYLRTNCSFYAILGTLYIFRNLMQGLGHTLPVMFSGMMQMIMHGIVALGLSPRFGFTVLMFENPAAWFGATVLISICFAVTFRRLTRQAAEQPARTHS
ncbi:MAG: hypothetical protein IKL84_08400, partial [Clostridia bacterium]|nr:hypothetical protein [Clostridia bacterium]